MTSHFSRSSTASDSSRNRIPNFGGGAALNSALSGAPNTSSIGGRSSVIKDDFFGNEELFISSHSSVNSNHSNEGIQTELGIHDPNNIDDEKARSEMIDEELASTVWDAVTRLLEQSLVFNENLICFHNKGVIEEVVKSSQNLDMQVMNFIMQTLLPNCSKVDKDLQKKLIGIIDNGCSNYYSSYMSSTNAPSFGQGSMNSYSASLSKFCLSNMFDLCRFDEELTNDNYMQEIKLKISKITTPVLINRCRETLRKFINDERKSGSMPLPRSRLTEVTFILERLKSLEIYPNLLVDENEQMPQHLRGKKSHLIQLLPLLADCVTSKEAELKEFLKDIFFEISKELGIPEISTSGMK